MPKPHSVSWDAFANACEWKCSSRRSRISRITRKLRTPPPSCYSTPSAIRALTHALQSVWRICLLVFQWQSQEPSPSPDFLNCRPQSRCKFAEHAMKWLAFLRRRSKDENQAVLLNSALDLALDFDNW